ncbi:MAG: ABC transporter permease, partial [Alphaproteobacteria bacterium]
MTPGRHQRWLLLRVAAQNLGRRRGRALLLGLAVTLSAGIWFASFVAGWALRDGIATSFARMGADLVVVPRATLVNLTASLLTVQPTDATLDAALQRELTAIPGIARVAPQRLVPSLVDGRPASLIAFEADRDFSVRPWLAEHRPGRLADDSMIAGFGMPGKLGERLSVCGRPFRIDGRLAKTGVGPFDSAYFISFDALAALVAFCRGSGQKSGGNAAPAPAGDAALVDAAQAPHAACAADLPLERVSAFLIQLAPSARVEDVKFAIARLPDVRI